MHRTEHDEACPRAARRSNWVLVGFLVVAAFFLLTEHRAHMLGILPYLLFLACPLMHLLHHGHGHHHGGGGAPPSDRAANADEAHHDR